MHSSTQPGSLPAGEDGLLLLQELETELRRIEQDVAARFGNEQELQRRYHENLKRLQSLERTMQHLKKMQGGPVNGTEGKETVAPTTTPVLSTFVPPLRPLNPPPPPPTHLAPAPVPNLPDLLPPSASTTPPIPPPPPPRPPPTEPPTSPPHNPPPLPPRAPTTTLQTVPSLLGSIPPPPPPPPPPPVVQPPPRPVRDNLGVVSQKCKVEVVYSLLNMLGTHDKEDISRTLLAMSSSPETCLAMRHSGCLPRIIELLHGSEDGETSGMEDGEGRGRASRKARRRAAQALHNMVHTHPDSVRRRHEAKVLRLLEQLRAHCDQHEMDDGEEKIDHHPGPAVAALMKLSFEEDYREAICTLGGLQAIAELLRVDFSVSGLTEEQYSITMRRYSCMALTNLTFGDEKNKVILCSMASCMKALVHQLDSDNEELRQVAASVLRNLSWRATDTCKAALRKVAAPRHLMMTALHAQKETTLKSILSALWNLSAHSTENKMDICSVDNALHFLVEKLSYRSPSRSFAIVENTSGILRNISSAIASIDAFRQVLREANAFPILLQHLRSPSLTIVSNACGTLWNLSSNSHGDQQTLWELGAVAMLKNLIHSKHKMISMGSAAALKNLLTARPHLDPEMYSAPSSPAYSTRSLPSHSIGLHMRKQKALEAFVDKVLSESGVELDPPVASSTSPRRSTSNDSMKSFNSDLSHDRASTLPPKMSLSAHYTSSGRSELSAQHCASLLSAVEPVPATDVSQEWRAITQGIQRLTKPSNDVFAGRSASGEQLLLFPVSRSSTSENIEAENGKEKEEEESPPPPPPQPPKKTNLPQPTTTRRRSLSGSRGGPTSSLPRPSAIPRISRSASFEEKPPQSRLPLPVNPARSRSNSRERSRIPMAVEAPSMKRAASAGKEKRVATSTTPKPKLASGIRPPSIPSKVPTPRSTVKKPPAASKTPSSPRPQQQPKNKTSPRPQVKVTVKSPTTPPHKDGTYWLKSKGKGVEGDSESMSTPSSTEHPGVSQLTVENLSLFNNQRRGSLGKRSIISDEGGAATYTLSEVSHDSCTETIEIDNSSEADDLAGSLEIDASVCRDDATENDSCSELESDDDNMIGGLPRIKEAEEDLDGQGLDEIEVAGLEDEEDTSLALRIGAQTVLAQLACLQAEDDAFFETPFQPPAMFQSEPPRPESADETSATDSSQSPKRRGAKIVKPDLSGTRQPPKKEAQGIRGGRRSISGVQLPVSTSRPSKPQPAAVTGVRMTKAASKRAQATSKASPGPTGSAAAAVASYQKPAEVKKPTSAVSRPTTLKSKPAAASRTSRPSPVVAKPNMPCLTSPVKSPTAPKGATKTKSPTSATEKAPRPRPPPLVMPKGKDVKTDPALDIWICRDEVCPQSVKVKTPSPASTLKCPSTTDRS